MFVITIIVMVREMARQEMDGGHKSRPCKTTKTSRTLFTSSPHLQYYESTTTVLCNLQF